MTIYSIEGPDGKTYEIEGPKGATREQVVSAIRRRMPAPTSTPTSEEQGGFFSGLSRGISQGADNTQLAYSSSLEGLGKVTGSEGLQQYGSEGIAENEEELAASGELSNFRDVDDISSGATFYGETLGQMLPQTAISLGAGAATGYGYGKFFGTPGAVAGTLVGLAGAAAAQLPYFYGSNRERQKESIEQGIKTEINEGTAFFASLPQTLLDSVVDRVFIGKIPLFSKGMMKDGGIFTRAVKGATRGTIAEVPTELGQTMLERAQAGLSLDNDEAIEEYKGVAIAAGMVGSTLGGVGNLGRKPRTAEEIAAEIPIEEPTTPRNKFGIVSLEESFSNEELDDANNALSELKESITEDNQEEYILQERALRRRVVEGNESKYTEESGAVKEDLIDAEMDKLRTPFRSLVKTPTEKKKTQEELDAEATAVRENQEAADEFINPLDDTISPEDVTKMRERNEEKIAVEENAKKTIPLTDADGNLIPTYATTEAASKANREEIDQAKEIRRLRKEIDVWNSKTEGQLREDFKKTPEGFDSFNDYLKAKQKDIAGKKREIEVDDLALPTDPNQPTLDFTAERPTAKKPVTPKKFVPPVPEGQLNLAENRTKEEIAKARADEINRKAIIQKEKVDARIAAGKEVDTFENLVPGEKPLSMSINDIATIEKETNKDPATKKYVRSFPSMEEAIDNAAFDVGQEVEYNKKASYGDLQAGYDALIKDNLIRKGKITDQSRQKAEVKLTKEREALIDESNKDIASLPEVRNYTGAADSKTAVKNTIKKRVSDKDINKEIKENFYRYADFSDAQNEEKLRSRVSDRALSIKKAAYQVGEGPNFGKSRANKLLKLINKNKNLSPELKQRVAARVENKKNMGAKSAPNVSDLVNRDKKAAAQQAAIQKDTPRKKPTTVKSRTQLSDTENQIAIANRKFLTTKKDKKEVTARQQETKDKRTRTKKLRDTRVAEQKEYNENLRQEAIDSLTDSAVVNLFNVSFTPTENQINKETKKLLNQKLKALSETVEKSKDPKLSFDLNKEYRNLVAFAEGLKINVTTLAKAIDNALIRNQEKIAVSDNKQSSLFADAELEYESNRDPSPPALPLGATVDLNKDLDPIIEQQLIDGVDTTTTLKNLSSKILDTTLTYLIDAIIPKITNVKITVVDGLKNEKGEPLNGIYRTADNSVELDSKNGMTVHTLLHELYHAATYDIIEANKIPAVKQLNALFNEVKKELGGFYGATNVQEFVAEARSNLKFRDQLSIMYTKGNKVSLLGRFTRAMNNIFRVVTGRKKQSAISVLTETDAIIDAILSPTIDGNNDTSLNLSQITSTSGKPNAELAPWARSVYDIIEKIKDFTQANIILGLLDGPKLGAIAKEAGFGKIVEFQNKVIQTMRGDKSDALFRLGKSIEQVEAWTKNNVKSAVIMKDLIYNTKFGATIYNVDPTKPKNYYAGKFLEGNDLAEIHKKQLALLNTLEIKQRTELLEQFKLMRDTYRDGYKKFRDSLYNRIDEMDLGKEATARLKKGIMTKLFPTTTIEEMVYFPLQRKGDWILRYTNPDVNERVYLRYTTKKERDMVKDVVEKAGGTDFYSPLSKETKIDTVRTIGSDKVLNEIYDTLKANNVDSQVLTEFTEAIINNSPESAALNIYRARTQVLGYDADYLAAFRTVPKDISNAQINIEYGRRLGEIALDIDRRKEKLDGEKKFMGIVSLDAIYNSAQERRKFALFGAENKGIESKVRFLNQVAFMYTIGFNVSSAMIQLAQIPIFTYGYLGAEYGYRESAVAIGDAIQFVFNSRKYADSPLGKVSIANGVDAYYTSDKKGNLTVRDDITNEAVRKYAESVLGPVQDARKRGLLDNNIIFDSAGLYDVGGDKMKATKALDAVTAFSGMMFNQAERFNRQVTLLAAYNLEQGKIKKSNGGRSLSKKQKQNAIDESFVRAQFSNGGTSLETGAPILKQGLGRVAGMYKSYGLNMYSTMFASAYTFFNNAYGRTAEGKKLRNIAFKRLVGVHMSSLLLTGVYGVPLYGAMRLFLDLTYFEDEEDKTDDVVRAYFGEGKFKGLVNSVTGLNVADRLRLTGLLITEDRFNQTDKSPEEAVVFYMGGPALSTFKRLYRAKENFAEGNIDRGVEDLLPAGLANVVKAFGRYEKDGGIRSKSGAPVYMDITAGEKYGQAFGFAPRDYALIQDQNRYKKRIEMAITTEYGEIMAGLRQSILNKKFDDQRKWREKQKDYNKRHPEYPLLESSITTSVKSAARARQLLDNGVTLNENVVHLLRGKAADKFDPDS